MLNELVMVITYLIRIMTTINNMDSIIIIIIIVIIVILIIIINVLVDVYMLEQGCSTFLRREPHWLNPKSSRAAAQISSCV